MVLTVPVLPRPKGAAETDDRKKAKANADSLLKKIDELLDEVT